MNDDLLRRAVERSGPQWGSAQARRVAEALLSRQRALHVDWDAEAGERWLRLLDDERSVVLISATIPLVCVELTHLDLLDDPSEEYVLMSSKSFHEIAFSSSRAVIGSAFPGASKSTAFNPDAYSIMELWFATV